MPPLEPADAAELKDILGRCGAEHTKVETGGRFTKRAMGGSIEPAGVVLSTARLNRVVDYEPGDLTISVEPGLGCQALQDVLAGHRQMLPLDPPRAPDATIGGVVAANCCGPRRRLYGSARDLVIGMTFVTLAGEEVRSGGMVVKNVAGLDMAKLLIGSFGTLAVISRINFKVIPRPPEEKTFALVYDSLDAALKARDAILKSVLQPAALDLVNPAAAAHLAAGLPARWIVLVEAGGIEAVMARYERELKHLAGDAEFAALDEDQAPAAWRSLRDFPALNATESGGAVLRLSAPLARLGECFSLAGSLPAVARAGNGVVYVRCPPGHLDLAARARAGGLYAVIESSAPEDKKRFDLWADPGPELEIMARIKRTLDPENLLNHGRLYNRL